MLAVTTLIDTLIIKTTSCNHHNRSTTYNGFDFLVEVSFKF